MKIGIIGTRGIPNYYGGFEECAQQLAVRLVKRGHSVSVYNSHQHPYQQKEFQGVELIHKYDPEHRIGTVGQFVYDLNCILDARWRSYDVLLMLGYTSSSVWQRFLPAQPVVITNMDGLEWQRSKYSRRVQQFLRHAESWAAKGSDLLIADSLNIQSYLESRYGNQVVHVAYGSEILKDADPDILKSYSVEPDGYNMLVARLEPENNLETILAGVVRSESRRIFLVIGNHHTAYGQELKDRFKDSRIRFVKATFNKQKLNNLRYFCHLYFHGHSVGGTNPSLLEAMGCSCMICAHENPYNKEVLGSDAHYFMDSADVANALDYVQRSPEQKEMISNNLKKIRERYNWDLITDQYELVMQQTLLSS